MAFVSQHVCDSLSATEALKLMRCPLHLPDNASGNSTSWLSLAQEAGEEFTKEGTFEQGFGLKLYSADFETLEEPEVTKSAIHF